VKQQTLEQMSEMSMSFTQAWSKLCYCQ